MATTNYGITTLLGSSLVRDIDTNVNTALSDIDGKMVGYSQGTLASRPTSSGGSPGVAGRLYRVTSGTQVGHVYRDNGTGWDDMGFSLAEKSSGSSIIAAEESRTNTAFGLLGTADRVQGITVPTGGIIVIRYKALWKGPSPGGTQAAAAIFIGSNQLKVPQPTGSPLVSLGQTFTPVDASPNYNQLVTCPVGLLSAQSTTSDALSDVTTGQTLAVSSLTPAGACEVIVDPGTYDISVQFNASPSGTVFVKERKLLVEVRGF